MDSARRIYLPWNLAACLMAYLAHLRGTALIKPHRKWRNRGLSDLRLIFRSTLIYAVEDYYVRCRLVSFETLCSEHRLPLLDLVRRKMLTILSVSLNLIMPTFL